MQRQILFKAQRVDGKGWVEGNLVVNEPTNSYRIFKDFACVTHGNFRNDEMHLCSGELHLVIPETVCQYVWITDDDKNKIFQSDKCYFETDDYFDNENATFSEGYKGEVTIEFDEHGVFFRTECNETLHISILEYLDYKLKLIGNVHDKNEE